ncbi:RND efflux system, outer membrane lipoprotein, NodT, partial [Pseudomonas syringae pv. actinidiae ICMP 19096]
MTQRLAFTSRPLGLLRPLGLGLCIALLSACAVGPDYQKP